MAPKQFLGFLVIRRKNLSTVITNSGLTLNGLTVNDYLANHEVHLNGGTDTEEAAEG